MKVTVIKTLGGLKPYDTKAEEVFSKIKLNEPIIIDVTRPRNVKFHRKFFSLIRLVFENQEHYNNQDELRNDLTIESGYFTTYVNKFTGEEIKRAKSISFAKMDELEFSKLYNDFLNTVIRVFGWDGEDIEENIASYI